jgi:hypothetical protein
LLSRRVTFAVSPASPARHRSMWLDLQKKTLTQRGRTWTKISM